MWKLKRSRSVFLSQILCSNARSEDPMSSFYNGPSSSPYKQDSFALANSKAASSNLWQSATRLASRYSPLAVILLLCYAFLLDHPACDGQPGAVGVPATGFRAAIAERVRGHRDALNSVTLPSTPQDLPDAIQLADLALKSPIPQKPYKLVMCTRIWNEAKYLDEWILYHYLIGFDHFMLDDHGSTDNTTAILEPYIKAGMVSLTHTAASTTIAESEFAARYHCLDGSVVRNEDMDWVTQIDVDEMLVLSRAHIDSSVFRPADIYPILDDYSSRKESVVQVTRFHFGTSNTTSPPVWPNGQGNTFVDRHVTDYHGNFWPKTMCKAGFWKPVPGGDHATQHTAMGIEGWKKVTPIHEEIAPRPETWSEWDWINSWPPVVDPIHITHYQTRSLDECLAKQRHPKTSGSWRADAGEDATCNSWHADHKAYDPSKHTPHPIVRDSVYHRATLRLIREGGLFRDKIVENVSL